MTAMRKPAAGYDLIDRLAAESAREEQNSFEQTGGLPKQPPAGGNSPAPAKDTAIPFPAEGAGMNGKPPPEAPAEFSHHEDGLFNVFSSGGGGRQIVYKIGGVKALFVTSLRVSIIAEYQGLSYFDNLDLFSARNRAAFAQALREQFDVEAERVKNDLARALSLLVRRRDAAVHETGGAKPVVMSEQDREAAAAFLRDEHMFRTISDDLSALGYVGEELNKQLLYLCASSRKLDDPISVLIISQSASGKSYLVDCVRRLMPEEEVIAVTSLSDQALNYIDDLRHKFLILGEAVHGEVIEHQIREMLSGKELSRMVTVKDPQSGVMRSQIIKKPVIVASVMGSTSYRINAENASRCFVVNTDESSEQTERIYARQREKRVLDGKRQGAGMVRAIVAKHQAAQRLLARRNIVNDFAPLLDFPKTLMRLRRDHDRFLDLIEAVCFLRQYQKKVQYAQDYQFISCDIEDYATAYRIMLEGVLSSTVRELPRGAIALYDDMRRWVKGEAKKQRLAAREIGFTQRQVREVTGCAHTWVKQVTRQLVDYEYFEIVSGGGSRSKTWYRLKSDEEISRADLSMIPTPNAMRKKIAETGR